MRSMLVHNSLSTEIGILFLELKTALTLNSMPNE